MVTVCLRAVARSKFDFCKYCDKLYVYPNNLLEILTATIKLKLHMQFNIQLVLVKSVPCIPSVCNYSNAATMGSKIFSKSKTYL